MMPTFNLIVCTYKRPQALLKLLKSVREQNLYPNEILIVDASPDSLTEKMIEKEHFQHLQFFKAPDEHKGLTRQRNFGIAYTGSNIEICCFLDDDIVLEPTYFKELIATYQTKTDAVGVGGRIIEGEMWRKGNSDDLPRFNEFEMDGYIRRLGSRNVFRKRLGLLSNKPPGYMPEFSHGFSTGFLPPSGKIYPVEFFMGGVASYKKELFERVQFSSYFEGYGLYEDLDFCLSASKLGQLYFNTAAACYHEHDPDGRPDYYKYGKMMINNGHYVWRAKYPNPALKARFKWNLINLLLLSIRMKNGLIDKEKGAIKEAKGRFYAWIKLTFNNR